MVAYDVDGADDTGSSLAYNSVRARSNRTDYDDFGHGDVEGEGAIVENHSFRSMSRLMLLDSSCARSDNDATKRTTTKHHKKRTERRRSGSAAAIMEEQQRDLYETGQWGVVSRRDKMCFAVTLLILTLGIAMAFVFGTTAVGGNDASGSNQMDASPKTPTLNDGGSSGGNNNAVPPLSGTSIGVNRNPNDRNDTMYYTDTEQYDALRTAIRALAPESIASQILLRIPEKIQDFVTNFDDDPNIGDVYQRAMSWYLYNDTVTIKHASELVSRYVLVVTYFNNGGASQLWTNTEHWMTEYHVCLWFGVQCNNYNYNRHQSYMDIIEMDLSNNGLIGPIHLAWTLLSKCKSILLNSNQIDGTIPGVVFGNIISLEYLYLQNNMLDGTIPSTLKSITSLHNVASSLSTLYVQGNPNLTGSWPMEFCPSSSSTSNNNSDTKETDVIRPIFSYGMDCNTIQCSCCDPVLHCFN
jgi:hypothetical protein